MGENRKRGMERGATNAVAQGLKLPIQIVCRGSSLINGSRRDRSEEEDVRVEGGIGFLILGTGDEQSCWLLGK